MGLAVLLSACGGGLQSEQTTLEPQRVDSCTYQGGVRRSGDAIAADASANCKVVKNGYDYVTAITTLQYAYSKEGYYYTEAGDGRQTIAPKSPSTYTIGFSHIDTEAYCNRGNVWYRAKMTVQWRNGAGALGGSTFYTSPSSNNHC